jgi:hypothetical protein
MGILAAWVAWRAANPKRQLEYQWTQTQLLASESLGTAEPDSVTVAYKEMPIADPYVFTLTVRSLGRKDIRSSDFDGDRPLVFDIGAEVKAVLDSKVRGGVLTGLTRSVQLSPGLFRPGNVFSFTALTEGPATVACHSPIVDVEVKWHEEPYHPLQIRISSTRGGGVILVLLWLSWAVAAYLSLVPVRRSGLAMGIVLGLYTLLYPVGIIVMVVRINRGVRRRENAAAADW